jgi:hypothetical protein
MDHPLFQLIGENEVYAQGIGSQTFGIFHLSCIGDTVESWAYLYDIPEDKRIVVQRGDVIGWRIEGSADNLAGTVSFDYKRGNVNMYLTMTMNAPKVGENIAFQYLFL